MHHTGEQPQGEHAGVQVRVQPAAEAHVQEALQVDRHPRRHRGACVLLPLRFNARRWALFFLVSVVGWVRISAANELTNCLPFAGAGAIE